MYLSLVLAILAFAFFGLASDAHHQQRLGGRPDARRKRTLKAGGWTCVALTFPAAIGSAGWVFGPIVWLGILMLGAAMVFLTLNFWPVRPK